MYELYSSSTRTLILITHGIKQAYTMLMQFKRDRRASLQMVSLACLSTSIYAACSLGKLFCCCIAWAAGWCRMINRGCDA